MNLPEKIVEDIQHKITEGTYTGGRLPSERKLMGTYHVSRATVRAALVALADRGWIFRKNRSGYFVNEVRLSNADFYRWQSNSAISMSAAFGGDGSVTSKVLRFAVESPDESTQRMLALDADEQVYGIERVRYRDKVPVSIEIDYIPVALCPKLSLFDAHASLVRSMESYLSDRLNHMSMVISAQPSSKSDQRWLSLLPTEPVAMSQRLIFTSRGTPAMLSNVRMHYGMFRYLVNVTQ